jgi:hypothetical protein
MQCPKPHDGMTTSPPIYFSQPLALPKILALSAAIQRTGGASPHEKAVNKNGDAPRSPLANRQLLPSLGNKQITYAAIQGAVLWGVGLEIEIASPMFAEASAA